MSSRIALRAAIIGSAFALVGICGAAHAATETIDGITFPTGIVPGGDQIQSGILDETLITGSGQTLQGVGIVNTINAPGAFVPTWLSGNNGVELAFVVDGYVSNTATYPNITFKGGTVSFYVLPFGTEITGYGSVAADIAAVESGTLFLGETAAPEDAAGDTLISQITQGTSLTVFTAGDGNGFLDATSGPAAPFFATQTFANSFNSTGFSDMSLTSDFTTGSADMNFGVSGSATLKANAVPEPISLCIMGVGLVGLGMARRRRM